HLERLATYVESLPAAWADADQEQRNQLAGLIYEELWVDGPRLVYVKPRPEVEPLFKIRCGSAQPTRNAMSELSTTVRSGDPDGGRSPHLPSLLPCGTRSPHHRDRRAPARRDRAHCRAA